MKCPRCHQTDLIDATESGAPLQASCCARCGGGFVPDTGLEQIIEELNHSREQLRELAGLYGGMRLPCPCCRSRMSPLILRGAHLDLCFGCGGLWCDLGELERITHNRHALPAPRDQLQASSTVQAAQALVRVDERSLPQHLGRAALAAVGSMSAVWWLAGIAPAASAIVGVGALGGALALSRQESFDVLPRARRMMRWRGFVPPSLKEGASEPFPVDACVVVRAMSLGSLPLPLVVIDLVGPEGRDLTRLDGPMSPRTAWVRGPGFARALGVSVRFDVTPADDDALDAREATRTDLSTLARAPVVMLEAEPPLGSMLRRFPLLDARGELLAMVSGASAPLDRPTHLSDILDEQLSIRDAAGTTLARLWSTRVLGRRTTVLLNDKQEPLGHVEVARTPLYDTLRVTGSRGRRRASVRLWLGAPHADIMDGWGRRVGVLEARPTAHGTARPVTLTVGPERLTGDARIALVALAIHASLLSAVRRG